MLSIEGRSLIRTFLAGATKDAAVSSRALSKLERKYVNRFDSFEKNDYLCTR